MTCCLGKHLIILSEDSPRADVQRITPAEPSNAAKHLCKTQSPSRSPSKA